MGNTTTTMPTKTQLYQAAKQNRQKTFTWQGKSLSVASYMMKGGNVVKRPSAAKKKQGRENPWAKAVAQARQQLGLTGFVPINRGRDGKALYRVAKQIYG